MRKIGKSLVKPKKKSLAPIKKRKLTKNQIFQKRYVKFCSLLYKKKLVFIGENIIGKKVGKGPVIILGTHDLKPFRIEPLLIQSMTNNYVHWLTSVAIKIFKKRFVLAKSKLTKELMSKFENIDIDRLNMSVEDLKNLIKKSTDLVVSGKTMGFFPTAYSEYTTGFGHSGAIYIIHNAELELKKKIPIILVSIKKKSGKYHIMQEEITISDTIDRKKRQELTKKCISKLEGMYNKI